MGFSNGNGMFLLVTFELIPARTILRSRFSIEDLSMLKLVENKMGFSS